MEYIQVTYYDPFGIRFFSRTYNKFDIRIWVRVRDIRHSEHNWWITKLTVQSWSSFLYKCFTPPPQNNAGPERVNNLQMFIWNKDDNSLLIYSISSWYYNIWYLKWLKMISLCRILMINYRFFYILIYSFD